MTAQTHTGHLQKCLDVPTSTCTKIKSATRKEDTIILLNHMTEEVFITYHLDWEIKTVFQTWYQ